MRATPIRGSHGQQHRGGSVTAHPPGPPLRTGGACAPADEVGATHASSGADVEVQVAGGAKDLQLAAGDPAADEGGTGGTGHDPFAPEAGAPEAVAGVRRNEPRATTDRSHLRRGFARPLLNAGSADFNESGEVAPRRRRAKPKAQARPRGHGSTDTVKGVSMSAARLAKDCNGNLAPDVGVPLGNTRDACHTSLDAKAAEARPRPRRGGPARASIRGK